MSVVAADTFTGTNGTSIATTTTSTGGYAWDSGGGGGDFEIQSNQAQEAGNWQDNLYLSDISDQDDVEVSIKYISGSVGPMARVDPGGTGGADDNNYSISASGVQIALYKRVAGTATRLGSWTDVGLASGDKLAIKCESTTIKARVNDVDEITQTDSAHSTGKVGLTQHEGAGADGATCDDFSVDDLSAGGTTILPQMLQHGLYAGGPT